MNDDADEFLAELVEKWQDVLSTSEDWAEKNLAEEMIVDLTDVRHILHG